MTYKQKAIEACRQLAEKYRNPQGEIFFDVSNCPLCSIYSHCKGCPLASEEGSGGCSQFLSNRKAANKLSVEDSTAFWGGKPLRKSAVLKIQEAFIARAEFFEKIIPILEKKLDRRFTPSGWIFFKELDRDW